MIEMADRVNQVLFIGDLDQDPRELKLGGQTFVAFELLTTDSVFTKNQDIFVNRPTIMIPKNEDYADKVALLTKGTTIKVEGSLETVCFSVPEGAEEFIVCVLAKKISIKGNVSNDDLYKVTKH